MKKVSAVFLSVLLMIGMMGSYCSAVAKNPYQADMSGYTGLTDPDHKYLTSSGDMVYTKMQKGQTMTVFCGNTGCAACQEVVPILNRVAKRYDANLQYVNSKEAGQLGKMLYIFKPYCQQDADGGYRFGVPHVFFIKEGKVVAHWLGTAPGHDAYKGALSAAQEKQLEEIYTKGFELERA